MTAQHVDHSIAIMVSIISFSWLIHSLNCFMENLKTNKECDEKGFTQTELTVEYSFETQVRGRLKLLVEHVIPSILKVTRAGNP